MNSKVLDDIIKKHGDRFSFKQENGKTYLIYNSSDGDFIYGIVDENISFANLDSLLTTIGSRPPYQYNEENYNLLSNFITEIENSTGKKVDSIRFNSTDSSYYEVEIDGTKILVEYDKNTGSVNVDDVIKEYDEVSFLNEFEANHVSDENIDEVINYLNEQVGEANNFTYEKTENGTYILKLNNKVVLEIDDSINVGDVLTKVDEYIYSSSKKSNNTSNNSRFQQIPMDYNIAIDLEMYSEILSDINDCNIEFENDVVENFESGILNGELLKYFNQQYNDTYTTDYHDLRDSNGQLYNNIQFSIMNYMMVDAELEKNMDSIIDSIFSNEYDVSTSMFELNNTEESLISYDDYCALLNDNSDYFEQQKKAYIMQFILGFSKYADQFKGTFAPKMLNNSLETLFYGLYSGNNADEKLLEFKEEFGNEFFSCAEDCAYYVGYHDALDPNECPYEIPEQYWDGASIYDKALLCFSYFYEADKTTIKYDDGTEVSDAAMQYRDPYSPFFPALNKTLAKFGISTEDMENKKYVNDDYLYELPHQHGPLSAFTDSISRLHLVYERFDSTYQECSNNFLQYNDHLGDYSSETLYNNIIQPMIESFEEYNMFLRDQLVLDSGDSDSNRLAYNIFGYYEGDNISTSLYYNAADALFKYNGIENYSKKDIDELVNNWQFQSSHSWYDPMVKIYSTEGFDGMARYATYLYNNEHPEANISIEQMKERMCSSSYIDSCFRLSLYDSFSSYTMDFITDFTNGMNSLTSEKNSYDLCFAKKLDTQGMTKEEAISYIKNYGNNSLDINGMNEYLDDWMIISYGYMLKHELENNIPKTDSVAWKFAHNDVEGAPRGALNSIIVQGRAFDSAMNEVNNMSNGVLGATLLSFAYGFRDGISNFGQNVYDAFFADGLIDEKQYRQQFVSQLLSSDYSCFSEYSDPRVKGVYDAAFSTEYDINSYNYLLGEDTEKIINAAIESKLPKFELDYMLGVLEHDTYVKYKNVYSSLYEDDGKYFDLYTKLGNNQFLLIPSTIYNTGGRGLGNMFIPITLNMASKATGCKLLEAISITLTTLSAAGAQREKLQQSGVTDWKTILLSSAAHGAIEGLSEAFLTKVFDSSWGKAKMTQFAEKFPVIGNMLSLSTNLNLKIDNMPNASPLLKAFLKQSVDIVDEIFEELGENYWGYAADGVIGLGWPSFDEIRNESLATIWQTALSNLFITGYKNAFITTISSPVFGDSKIDINDLYQFIKPDGSYDVDAFLKFMKTHVDDSVEGEYLKNNFNGVLGANVVSSVNCGKDGIYTITLSNNEVIEYNPSNSNGYDIYKSISDAYPSLLVEVLASKTRPSKNLLKRITALCGFTPKIENNLLLVPSRALQQAGINFKIGNDMYYDVTSGELYLINQKGEIIKTISDDVLEYYRYTHSTPQGLAQDTVDNYEKLVGKDQFIDFLENDFFKSTKLPQTVIEAVIYNAFAGRDVVNICSYTKFVEIGKNYGYTEEDIKELSGFNITFNTGNKAYVTMNNNLNQLTISDMITYRHEIFHSMGFIEISTFSELHGGSKGISESITQLFAIYASQANYGKLSFNEMLKNDDCAYNRGVDALNRTIKIKIPGFDMSSLVYSYVVSHDFEGLYNVLDSELAGSGYDASQYFSALTTIVDEDDVNERNKAVRELKEINDYLEAKYSR